MKPINLSKDKFKQWKEALQSGKWEAFRGFLHNEQNTLQACCLGVLNEINTGEISLRQLPSSYPENFYLSEIELKDLSVELQTKIKHLVDAYDIPTLKADLESCSLTSIFAHLNDGALLKNLEGSREYKQVIELIDLFIEEDY